MSLEALKHEIIEAAKLAHKDEPTLPFVRHLEIAAQDLARGYEIRTWVARGTWHLELEQQCDAIADDHPGLL